MRKTTKSPGEKIIKDIKRATRKLYSAQEKIRIVLDGLRGEDSIAELYHREGRTTNAITRAWGQELAHWRISKQYLKLHRTSRKPF